MSYHTYLMRHGESWVQDLIERLERYDGVRSDRVRPLEDRWNDLMAASSVAV